LPCFFPLKLCITRQEIFPSALGVILWKFWNANFLNSIGGIIGTTVFRAKDAPNYRPGMLACLLANALIVIIVAALSFKFHRANKRVDAGGKAIEGLPGFKYTL
jgi:hypothetical protein